MADAARTIGVVGAGTMGAGIAQMACTSGARTVLYDPVAEALEQGGRRIGEGLDKMVSRGRLDADDAAASKRRLKTAGDLETLAQCELVIEAAPEDLDIKEALFASLSEIVDTSCVLATNTSSLLVTRVAAAATSPERVVGMHFFNPPPLMKLLEVVPGLRSDDRAVELAVATGEAMGKSVIVAADVTGFIVNRCGRPFSLEGMRLLQERLGDARSIDRACRLGGGFRMGPFELVDLVGLDISREVARSFFAQSGGEPRWRPSPIVDRLVAAGMLGRKTGRGFFEYGDGVSTDDGPEQPANAAPAGRVRIQGGIRLADELRARATENAWQVTDERPDLIIDCRLAPEMPDGEKTDVPRASLCAGLPLAGHDSPTTVGFHLMPPIEKVRLVELTKGAAADETVEKVEGFFGSLGLSSAWVGDAPGLIVGRIVSQLINEAAFSLGEGVGGAADIDTGMELGLNYPRGPFAWAQAVGVDHVLAILDGLYAFYHEERYRAAPVLRRMAAEGAEEFPG